MKDPRIALLAKNLVENSVRVQAGDRVLIQHQGATTPLMTALVEAVYARGGQPFVWQKDPSVMRAVLMGLTEEQVALWAENEAHLMEKMQCYIGVSASDNANELSDVPDDRMTLYSRYIMKKVHFDIRVSKTRWVVLRYPNAAMAQSANMSTEAFEDYYFNVCCLDYAKMSRAMDPLVARMAKADRVRILGRGTDLQFSIKGIPVHKCDGECNIPDGEIFTAPVRDSVNGVLRYNTPSLYDGTTFENVEFTFKDGKIVKATANHTEKLNSILDTDPGARYIGEFAIGVNPYITSAIKDTLFDEKIAGSFHFTPGSVCDDCVNGNESAIHWDLVCIQTPEYGGGEMWLDDELIRKDGRFVPDDLQGLNPENLK